MKSSIDIWIKKAYEEKDIYNLVNINKREIYWHDYESIDGENVQAILSILDKLEEIHPTKTVNIKFNNDGGSPTQALLFINRLKNYKFKIDMYGEGLLASASTIIFMGTTGTKTMSPHSHMMFHQISSWNFGSEKKEDAKSRLKYYDSLTNIIVDMYIQNSNIKTKEEWDKILLTDTYFTAKECLDLGIISEIK